MCSSPEGFEDEGWGFSQEPEMQSQISILNERVTLKCLVAGSSFKNNKSNIIYFIYFILYILHITYIFGLSRVSRLLVNGNDEHDARSVICPRARHPLFV